MTLTGVVLGDVCEVSEVVSVLAGAVDVTYLVFTNQFLRTIIRRRWGKHYTRKLGFKLPDFT
jgi:hypothetical protein